MKITSIATSLNENADNRYALTFQIAEIAKKLLDESSVTKEQDDLLYSHHSENITIKTSVKPVIQAIMMKASESDAFDDELIG